METVKFDTAGMLTEEDKKNLPLAVKTITKEGDNAYLVLSAYLILLAKGGSSPNCDSKFGFEIGKNRYTVGDLRRILVNINDSATLRQVSRSFADETSSLLLKHGIITPVARKAKLDQDEYQFGFDGADYCLKCTSEVKQKLQAHLREALDRRKKI